MHFKSVTTSLACTSRRGWGDLSQSLVYSIKPIPLYPCDFGPKKGCSSKQIMLSDLPQDLVRLILEQAAAMCSKTAIALTLVSKQVHAWVERILYYTVVLWTSRSIDLFRIPFNSKPKSFFALHVRNLFINGKYGMDIILACTNVKRLAVYPLSLIPLDPLSKADSPTSLPSTSDVRQHNAEFHHYPVEIMLLGYLEDVPWSSSIFHCVRYLYFGVERPTTETAACIARLPCLTHCAFPYDGDERSDDSLISTVFILLQSKSLAYLVVLINEEQDGCDQNKKKSTWKQLAGMNDRRLLVGTECCFDGNDWLEMVNNDIDMWGTWISEYKNWRNLAE